MQITVAYVNQPKPGKKMGTVKTKDNALLYFFPDKFTPEQGKSYDVETESSEFQGQTYNKVKKWKPIEAQTGGSVQGSAGGGTSSLAWLPMASNTVAHAIQSGLITTPEQIKVWVLAVKKAVEGDVSS